MDNISDYESEERRFKSFRSRYEWRLSGMDEESVLKTPAGDTVKSSILLASVLGM
jgi:hypothetical protein